MKSLLLASSALVLIAAAPAAAEETQPPPPADSTVDSLTVTGLRDPEEPAVVATARQRLSETPGAVSVISQESYARRAALGLDDMLRDAPGVYAQRKFGGDIRISIRGSGIGNANHNRGLLIAQDGVPLNEADGYGDSQIADPLLTRFAEVYRGGNALRFGGALLGGAINMVTPNGRNAGFDNQVRLEGGSYGLARQNVQIARTFGDWDMLVAGTNLSNQGWRDRSHQAIQFGSLNLGRSFGDGREVRLIVNGSNIDQELNGAVTLRQFNTDPSLANPGNVANNYARDQRGVRTSLRTDWRLTDSLSLQAAVYGVWKDLNHPIFQVIDQQSRNYGAFARLDWDGQVGGLRADAYAGAWLRTGDLDSHFYVNQQGNSGALQSKSLQNAEAADLFAEGRLFVSEHVALVAGATAGRAVRDYQSFAVPGVSTTFNLTASKTYDWVAPRLGILWQAEDGAQVFANVTNSVEPPNFGSLTPINTGFQPVQAQDAWTAELGTRGRRGAFTWDLTVYRAWLDKELLQFTVANGVPASTFNADKTIHQGFEGSLDWRLAKGWRLRQTYTFSDFRFDGDGQYGDNVLPIVPKHFYRAELRYQSPQGWFLAPSLERSSAAWVDYRNTTRSPAYTIVSLNAGWNITDRASVFVDIRNLADKAYVTNVQAAISALPTMTAPDGPAVYWPGDGRTAVVGLTYAF